MKGSSDSMTNDNSDRPDDSPRSPGGHFLNGWWRKPSATDISRLAIAL
jgi:hypothetical protein